MKGSHVCAIVLYFSCWRGTSRRGGWVGMHYSSPAGWPEHQDRTPAHCQSAEEQTMALTGASGPVQFSHLLYVVSLICCAEAIQLALSSLSRGISLNIGVHSMCSWEMASSASCAILGPSLYTKFLISSNFHFWKY